MVEQLAFNQLVLGSSPSPSTPFPSPATLGGVPTAGRGHRSFLRFDFLDVMIVDVEIHSNGVDEELEHLYEIGAQLAEKNEKQMPHGLKSFEARVLSTTRA